MIQTIAEIIIAVLLVGGGLFGLIGSWGLLRLKDPLQRLHAPTKSTTIGLQPPQQLEALVCLITSFRSEQAPL